MKYVDDPSIGPTASQSGYIASVAGYIANVAGYMSMYRDKASHPKKPNTRTLAT